MNIVVFGSTGKVGRLVVAEALRRGHHVTAFAHTSQPAAQSNLSVVMGDIKNKANVVSAITDADAVISALGSWGTATKDIVGTAMTNIIPAMEAAAITRIVSLTGNVAKAPAEVLAVPARLARSFLDSVAPKILKDGEKHLALLSASTLDWTVVRASVMINAPHTSYRLTATPRLISIVPRAAVAAAMVDLAESHDWSRQAPGIV